LVHNFWEKTRVFRFWFPWFRFWGWFWGGRHDYTLMHEIKRVEKQIQRYYSLQFYIFLKLLQCILILVCFKSELNKQLSLSSFHIYHLFKK
jgi:hypothetical protein